MKSQSSVHSIPWLLGVLTLVFVAGCQRSSAPAINSSTSLQTDPPSIDPGKKPSEEQRRAMLAAKDALFSRLSGRLQEAMGTQGPAGAIAVCQKEAQRIATDVGDEHELRIGRSGVRLRNPSNQPPAWATELTEKQTDTPHFVVLDDGDAAALLPIKLQGQCLMCHGPDETISPVIQDQLAKLYPTDEATGFQEGDLRGWFWVELPSG